MENKEKEALDHVNNMFKLVELMGINLISRSLSCIAEDIRTLVMIANSDPSKKEEMIEELRKSLVEALEFSGIKSKIEFEK